MIGFNYYRLISIIGLSINYIWFAAILTSGFLNLNDSHNGNRCWFACFVLKKGKDRSFVAFQKYQGYALKFVVVFVVCIVYMQRGTNLLSCRSEGPK